MTSQAPRLQPVYASINKPLTVGGTERRRFLVSLVLGAGTFTFFGSLLAGAVMFLTLYVAARWMTAHDPQWLRIVLRCAAAPVRFVSAKLDAIRVLRRVRR